MKLNDIVEDAERAISEARDPRALDEVRVRFLGKKGALTAQLKSLGALPAEQRPAAGAAINDAKQKVQAWLDTRESALRNEQLNTALEKEKVDVTLPGRRQSAGTGGRRLHQSYWGVSPRIPPRTCRADCRNLVMRRRSAACRHPSMPLRRPCREQRRISILKRFWGRGAAIRRSWRRQARFLTLTRKV